MQLAKKCIGSNLCKLPFKTEQPVQQVLTWHELIHATIA